MAKTGRGKGGARLPYFGISVNPISTRRGGQTMLLTILLSPKFSDLPPSLNQTGVGGTIMGD